MEEEDWPISGRIWVLGDAVVDLIPDGDENHLLKCPGGAPANVAVGVARLGGIANFIGKVGDDPMGKFMKEVLTKEGVGTSFMSLDARHRTSTVVVDLEPKTGERSFTFMVRPSADQFLEVADLPATAAAATTLAATFCSGDFLHFCSIALANEPSRSTTKEAIRRIKESGGFVSFDPNIRDEVWENPKEIKSVVLKFMKESNIVKVSKEELEHLVDGERLNSSDAVAKLLSDIRSTDLVSTSVPWVLVTDGENGTKIFKGEKFFQVNSVKVDHVIDTTGAGDAFMSGFLHHLSTIVSQNHLKNLDAVEDSQVISCVEKANVCGALTVGAKGAMTALPTKERLVEAYGSQGVWGVQ